MFAQNTLIIFMLSDILTGIIKNTGNLSFKKIWMGILKKIEILTIVLCGLVLDYEVVLRANGSVQSWGYNWVLLKNAGVENIKILNNRG